MTGERFRCVVRFPQPQVERDAMVETLRRRVGDDLSAREANYLPEIGVALGLSPDEAEVLRIGPDGLRVRRVISNALPLDCIGRAETAALPLVSTQSLASTRAPEVWELTKGAGVKVAILDSGVDNTHPDLKVEGGFSFVGGEEWYEDFRGHGTCVAGIIGARQGGPVSGVAPQCKLYAVKIVSKGNESSPDQIIAGLKWAIEHEMDVVNISVCPDDDLVDIEAKEELQRVAREAQDKGIFIAAAAGNTSPQPVRWPARCRSVMAVGALAFEIDRPAPWVRYPETCYGPDNADEGIEIMAPGEAVLTTGSLLKADAPFYATLGKTSAACPHVAGAAALLRAHFGLTAEQIRQRLRAGAQDMNPPDGRNIKTGFGRLDVYKTFH